MKRALTIAAAAALTLATASPAAAQGGTPYRPTDEYMQRQREYEAQRDAYWRQRSDYRAARAEHERRLAQWEARRRDYDARYGAGAYARTYPAPVWDESRWAYAYPYTAPYAGYGAPYAGYYGRQSSYASSPLRCDNDAAVTAGILGALAGAVLGSNVAARGRRTEGSVLGGIVGAGIGAAVGHASDKYRCDQRGAYWSYADTLPYRVDNDVYRDENHAYWQNRGCRLAPAPITETDYRYVRVCPDAEGRYRLSG